MYNQSSVMADQFISGNKPVIEGGKRKCQMNHIQENSVLL